MRILITLTAGIGLATALAGCNSLDALTPPADVGSTGLAQSSPLNDRDMSTMAEQQPVVQAAPSGAIARTPLQSSSDAPHMAFSGDGGGNAEAVPYATGSTPYRDPAGSLEAQASQLAHGSASSAPSETAHESMNAFPAETDPVRSSEGRLSEKRLPKLADEETAEPASEPTTPKAEAATDTPAKTAARSPDAAAAPANTIRFLPIIGAPVEAVKPLSEELGADARANGLTIKTAADPVSRHMLKGYFSAFKDGRKTVIVYVWDVLDGAGNRLHRIQGQDSVEAPGKDVWSGVPPQAMRDIGRKSIAAYLDWRDGQSG
ncbi:hypothetical protein ACLE20_05365 [Rhizobium sp. YIM 134829]|uniref:hypothetical protein n=1 Tax=Rhizobium sp. YIM 134829 TaxID=3390453 RepID=UPI0039799F82